MKKTPDDKQADKQNELAAGLEGELEGDLDVELDEQLVIEVNEELEVARCGFCGRSAFEVDRLVAQAGARICNICIKEFHARLKS